MYASLVVGLLVVIAFYPILKDRAAERSETRRRLLQDQSDAIAATRAALSEACSEVATRQLRAKEQKGLCGEASESARDDNLKYLPAAIQHVARLQSILDGEAQKASRLRHPNR